MRITEFEFTSDNHFVTMEYYWLILNRTFLVLITDNELIGIKVHGPIGVESNDALVNLLPLAVNGDLQNPYSYISAKYIERIKDIDLKSIDFLRANSSNFRINRSDIVEISYDPSRKWGMGYYPHDGKVYVNTRDYKKREFIILGTQSGQEIKNRLS
ncbi:MAG: hypothetical protein JST14_11560 [Bacteroidetes bacterium]|nr:hypothetical protein [Bacteroidota bacterium]